MINSYEIDSSNHNLSNKRTFILLFLTTSFFTLFLSNNSTFGSGVVFANFITHVLRLYTMFHAFGLKSKGLLFVFLVQKEKYNMSHTMWVEN